MNILAELFFSGNLALVIQGYLCFHVHFNIFFHMFVKNVTGIFIQIALNL